MIARQRPPQISNGKGLVLRSIKHTEEAHPVICPVSVETVVPDVLSGAGGPEHHFALLLSFGYGQIQRRVGVPLMQELGN